MPTKRSKNGIYSQRLRDIRPFVNFNYNLNQPLTRYQKRKINKYYKEIGELKARPFQVYRPRNPENLAPAQKFAQHERNLPGLKVAFIPTNGKDKLRIRIDDEGHVVARSKYVTTRGLDFDIEALEFDPEGEVARVIADDNSTHYAIRAGKFEIPRTATRELITGEVIRLMQRYSEGGESWHRKGHENNDWQNWLHGLNAYTFQNQAGALEYMQSKQDKKRELQRERRAEKRRCKAISNGKQCKLRRDHRGPHRY